MIAEKQPIIRHVSFSKLGRTRPFLKDLLAVLLLAIAILFFFREELQYNITFYETDTPAYYYPVMSDLVQAYREGTLRLWSTDMFGGFPLFADGEAGSLYPIHLLLLPFFTIDQIWVWLIAIRFFLAALFMYVFCRVIGLGQTSSLAAGLVTSFGGFSIGQLHHINVSNSAAWLPLTLAFIELAIRSRRWVRLRWLLLAGVSAAIQAVAVHVQVVLLSALFLGLYVPFRVILCPTLPFKKRSAADGSNRPEPLSPSKGDDASVTSVPQKSNVLLRGLGAIVSFFLKIVNRFFLTFLILGLPGLVGLALASVQLFPEYELGTFSMRAGGVAYSFASLYSLSEFNLLTFIFPYFFRDGNHYWGLWSLWESAVYVGILPLILSFLAIICVRSRYTLFLGTIAILSIWVGLGSNANPNIHYTLWELPGFNQMRAPSRFSYLELLAISILSAHAIEWLVKESSAMMAQARLSTQRRVSRAAFSIFVLMLIPALIALPVYLQSVTSWFTANKEIAYNLIKDLYLSLPRATRDLTLEEVYTKILKAISLENPDTQLAIGLIAASIVLLLLWERFRNTAWLWKCLTIALISFDLLSYSAIFHPRITIQQLSSDTKAIDFLEENKGMYRVFSWASSPMQPNRLFKFDVSEAKGYSSLEFQRNTEYSSVIETVENRLLDVWNVRYIPIKKEKQEPLPSFKEAQFYTRRLLMSSSSKNASATVSYAVPDKTTSDVRLIGWLRDSTDIPQGANVGEVILTDVSGAQTKLPIRAGIDVSEGAIDRPDVASLMRHSKATVAFSMPEQQLKGVGYQERLFYGNLPVPAKKPPVVRKVEIKYTYPVGKLQVFGLTLYDAVSGQPFALTPFMKEKYRIAYEDDGVIIYENMAYLPRTFLVPTAVPVESNFGILVEMTDGDWDPLKKVLIETPKDTPVCAPQAIPQSGIGSAAITEYKDRTVKIKASAAVDSYLLLTDSYYPGWDAYVDGQKVEVYRADYLFRAIFLPQGDHDIVFSFEPVWFKYGAIISLTTLSILCSLLLFWLSSLFVRWLRIARIPAKIQSRSPVIPSGEATAPLNPTG